MKNLSFISILISLIILFCHSIYAQTDSTNNDNLKLRVYYNEIPDSLYLNNRLITVQNGEDLKLPKGTYTFRAVRECYHEFNKTIEIERKRSYQIAIKLNEITTFKEQFYYYSYIFDLLFIPSIIYASFASEKSKLISPHTLAFSSGYLFWKLNQLNKFNTCNGVYLGKRNTNLWEIGLDISSSRSNWNISFSDQVSFRRIVNGVDFNIDFNRDIYAKIIPKSFAENYSINVNIKRYIFERLFLSAQLNYYPSMTVNIQAEERFQVGNTFHRNYETEDKNHFAQFGLDLNIIPFWFLNAKFFLSAGIYMSNKIDINKEFILDVVTPISSEIKQDTTIINYSFESNGYHLGIGFQFPITESFQFYSKYDFYSEQNSILMSKKEKTIIEKYSSGIAYLF